MQNLLDLYVEMLDAPFYTNNDVNVGTVRDYSLHIIGIRLNLSQAVHIVETMEYYRSLGCSCTCDDMEVYDRMLDELKESEIEFA